MWDVKKFLESPDAEDAVSTYIFLVRFSFLWSMFYTAVLLNIGSFVAYTM